MNTSLHLCKYSKNKMKIKQNKIENQKITKQIYMVKSVPQRIRTWPQEDL